MRKLVWFTAGFALVCLLCAYLGAGLCATLAVMLGAVFLFALWSGLRDKGWGQKIARRAAALSLGGALACGWFALWTATFRAPAEKLIGQAEQWSATVVTYPEETPYGARVTVELGAGARAPDVLLYIPTEGMELVPGDCISFYAEMRATDRIRGDQSAYYTAKGVFLKGSCDGFTLERHPQRPAPRFWPAWCGHALKASLYAAFDETAAPLCAAVVTGDKSGLDQGLSAYLSRTGTAHAVVVSGMHVTCLLLVAMTLLQNQRRLAFVCLPLLLFYALMAGGTPSALRAVTMQAVIFCAPLARRESDSPTALFFALLLLLVQNPNAAGSISLQLSFASVAGILVAAGPLAAPLAGRVRDARRRHAGETRWELLCRALNWVISSLCAGLAAMLFSQPVLALYFHRASLIFPLANLLVLWAVQLLLPLALLVGTLGLFLPGMAHLLAIPAGLPARYIIWVVTSLGRWRFAAVDTDNFYILVTVAALYLFLALALLAKENRPPLAIPAGCAGILLGAALLFTRLPVVTSDLTAVALNVGQGAATALLSGGRTCLVDCGGNQSDSAGDIAADYFAGLGLIRLDALVLTHFDSDHVNGLARLFDRMEVQSVAVPFDVEIPEELEALCAAEGCQVLSSAEPAVLELGEAALTLYPPFLRGEGNGAGQFVLCSAGDFDALITGDADEFVEKMLIKYGVLPDLELLFVGHHGSAGSTSARLLDAALPELAVISVGYNSYGHPKPETLERLIDRNIQVFRTDQLGTVSVYVRETEEGHEIRIDAR